MSLTIIKHTFGKPAIKYILVGIDTHIPGFAEIPENCPYQLLDFFKFDLSLSIHTEEEYQAAIDHYEKEYKNKAKKNFYLHVIELDERINIYVGYSKFDQSKLTAVFIDMLKSEISEQRVILPNTLMTKLLLLHFEQYADRKIFGCSIGREHKLDTPKEIFVDIPSSISEQDVNAALMVCSDLSVFQETYKGAPRCENFIAVFSADEPYRALPFNMKIASLKILREWLPNHLDAIKTNSTHDEILLDIYFASCLIDNYLVSVTNKKTFIHCCEKLLPLRWVSAIHSLIDELIDAKPGFLVIPHHLKILMVSNAINYLYDEIYTTLDPDVQRQYLVWSIAYPNEYSLENFIRNGHQTEIESLIGGWLSRKTPYKCLPFEYRIRQYPKLIIRLVSLKINTEHYKEFREKIFSHVLSVLSMVLSEKPRNKKQFNAAIIKLLTYLLVHCEDETFVTGVINRMPSEEPGTPPLKPKQNTSEGLELHHYELTDLDHRFKIYVTPGVKKNNSTYSQENLELFWERNSCRLIFAVGIPEYFSISDESPDFPPYFLAENTQCVARSSDAETAIRVYEIVTATSKRYVCHIPRPDRPPLILSETDLLFLRNLICYFNFNDEFKSSDGKLAIATHCMAGLNRSPTLAAIIANMLKMVVTKTEIFPDLAITYVRTISRTTNRLQQSSHNQSYNTIIHKPYEDSIISAIQTLNKLARASERTYFFSQSTQSPFFQPCIPDAFDFRYRLLMRISTDREKYMRQYHVFFEMLDDCEFNENHVGFAYYPCLLEKFISGTKNPNMTPMQRSIQSCLLINSLIFEVRHSNQMQNLERHNQEYEKLLINIFPQVHLKPQLPPEANPNDFK